MESPDARDLARAGLEDPDGFVRATSARLLGELGRVEDAGILVPRLAGDEDAAVRLRAAEALAAIGGDVAIEGLGHALADPAADVRLAVVVGLGRLAPGHSAPELARLAVEDPEWKIRVEATRALGATGAPDVLAVLEQALADENEFVRATAASARDVHRAAAARNPDLPPILGPAAEEPAASPVPSPSVSPTPTIAPTPLPKPTVPPTPRPAPSPTLPPTPTPEPTPTPSPDPS